jgi:hypothetical protein
MINSVTRRPQLAGSLASITARAVERATGAAFSLGVPSGTPVRATDKRHHPGFSSVGRSEGTSAGLRNISSPASAETDARPVSG